MSRKGNQGKKQSQQRKDLEGDMSVIASDVTEKARHCELFEKYSSTEQIIGQNGRIPLAEQFVVSFGAKEVSASFCERATRNDADGL